MHRNLLAASMALGLALSVSAWPAGKARQQEQQPQAQQGQQQPAQQPTAQQQKGEPDIVTWMQAYDEIGAEGWSARWLLNQPVYGLDGNEVGAVESLFIAEAGRIESVVIGTGGFIEIGAVPVRIPWEEISFTEAGRIMADVREETLPDFELFPDEPEPGARAQRAQELMGEFIGLEDEPAYGWVSDLVFNPDGEILAVIVTPSYGFGTRYGAPYGYYAYPWTRGYGFAGARPEAGLGLPYTTGEVAEMRPFDYEATRARRGDQQMMGGPAAQPEGQPQPQTGGTAGQTQQH